MNIKVIPAAEARNALSSYIQSFKSDNKRSFVIGRRSTPEAVIIPFPEEFNPELNDITNVNAYSSSFDFLHDEPDLYTREDIK